MSEEVAEVKEVESKEAEATEVKEGVEPEVVAEEKTTVPKAALDREVKRKWDFKRTADAAEARAQIAEAQLAELQKALKGEQTESKQETRGEKTYTAAEVAELVRQQGAAERFNQQCASVAQAGQKLYSDFDAAIGALQNVSPYDASAGRQIVPPSLVEAAFELGEDAPSVLYTLGKDTERAAQIMEMTPIRQAVALAKIADELKVKKAAKPTSKAPPPVESVVESGSAGGDFNPYDAKKMSAKEWIAQREAALRKGAQR